MHKDINVRLLFLLQKYYYQYLFFGLIYKPKR